LAANLVNWNAPLSACDPKTIEEKLQAAQQVMQIPTPEQLAKMRQHSIGKREPADW